MKEYHANQIAGRLKVNTFYKLEGGSHARGLDE